MLRVPSIAGYNLNPTISNTLYKQMFKCFQEFVGPSVDTDPVPGLYIPNDNNVKLTNDVYVCIFIGLLIGQCDKCLHGPWS